MNEPKVRRVLSGTSSANTCAYCAFHHCSLTPKQLKKQKCLAKNCDALIKHEHPVWAEREERKQVRRERKKRMEEKYNAIRAASASADSR